MTWEGKTSEIPALDERPDSSLIEGGSVTDQVEPSAEKDDEVYLVKRIFIPADDSPSAETEVSN